MATALEIVLAAGILVVGASYLGVVFARVGGRLLLGAAALLTAAALAAGAGAAFALVTDSLDAGELGVVCGGLVALAAAEAGAFALARGLERLRSLEQASDQALERIDATIAAHDEMRRARLEETLARERAETVHRLLEQELELRKQRREELAEEQERSIAELTETVTQAQRRLEGRLEAWSADLERAQQQLKVRLEQLIHEQADALQAHEARLGGHADELASLEDHQQATIARVRLELEQGVAQIVESIQADIETHAAERRRALHEVSDRLRARERSMREQIEREEMELRMELTNALGELERRHVEQLQRALDRAVLRLGEEAERRFDQQLNAARERTAERLGRELELQMEHFMRSAEKEVAARIAEAAQTSATKFQRQIDDVVRTAEGQTAVSRERIEVLSERLERALGAANDRLAEFETQIELELETKLGEFDRVLRSLEQTVGRERAQTDV